MFASHLLSLNYAYQIFYSPLLFQIKHCFCFSLCCHSLIYGPGFLDWLFPIGNEASCPTRSAVALFLSLRNFAGSLDSLGQVALFLSNTGCLNPNWDYCDQYHLNRHSFQGSSNFIYSNRSGY
jgi:hypothetical protein